MQRLQLTNRDKIKLNFAMELSKEHSSKGSYDMVALWAKGSMTTYGTNILKRPAQTIDPAYPEACGIHAELSLWKKLRDIDHPMKGGTVYIAGTKAKSGIAMNNTKPCMYCAALLESTRINFVVFLLEGNVLKSRPGDLIV